MIVIDKNSIADCVHFELFYLQNFALRLMILLLNSEN